MMSNIPVALHSPPESGPAPSAVEDPIPPAGPRHAAPSLDRPGVWLHVASAGLLVLAAAAAAVSFTAQYRLVYTARHLATAAGLEAAIPDAAALVFACLGIALALHGRRTPVKIRPQLAPKIGHRRSGEARLGAHSSR
jgi:hypothetical protein